MLQRPVEHGCTRAFFLCQVDVARAFGQSVGFSNDRHRDDLDGEVQILDHSPDDGHLLPVLLAKVRIVRLNDVKQLTDNGGNAAKVAWSVLPTVAC